MSKEPKNAAIFEAYEDSQAWDPSTPEKNLLRAMLITAMADLRKKGKVGRLARQYFLNGNDQYLFSFRSVCAFLDLDPEQILRKVGLLSQDSGNSNFSGAEAKLL